MRGEMRTYAIAAAIVVAGPWAAMAQNPAAAQQNEPLGNSPSATSAPTHAAPAASNSQAPAPATAPAIAGGRLHGVVKSGNIPLPGVTVTAQNTLTGKRYSTTTDINGAWSMTIPQDGRYVLRTEFAAFAQASGEALLNATGRDRTADFQLILASRAAQQAQQEARRNADPSSIESLAGQAIQQLTGNGAENLNLMDSLGGGADTGNGAAGVAGAELPSIASNNDFGGDSLAVSGQSGHVSPLAGVDMDRIRDAIETLRAQNGGQIPAMGGLFGGAGGSMLYIGGGALFAGGGGMFPGGGGRPGAGGGPGGGGFGGGGFGGPGGFLGGGGRSFFRSFNPAQPHGAFFWDGSNSALNAEPFALRGQPQLQPANGTNRFGLSVMTEPYIPHLTKPSGKDTVFFSLSGERSSSPEDEYGTVPTAAERSGDFSGLGLAPVYDPATGRQFSYLGTPNIIPPSQIASQATALLNYFPAPNITGANVANNYNYHLLTTAQSNSTQAGVRYMRSLGANGGTPGGRGGFGGFGRRGQSQNQGLRQSINVNYNWSHAASDMVNLFPQLGGKQASDSDSLQSGYTVSYHRVTSIFNTGWNRSNSHTINFFTNTAIDPGLAAGVLVPNHFPLNYGLPDVNLSNITGLTEQQPNFSLGQTISFSEVLAWRRGAHNLRFGGDYRRIHRDFLAGSDSTGSFTFTGLFTQNSAGDPTTGSALADFLLGLPQSTTLNSSLAKSYLRDNAMDAFAMDDWRALPYLTLNYGLRYEYYAPYTEKYGRLADVLTNPSGGFTTQTEAQPGAAQLPSSLVYPWRKAFAPRVGLALRVPKLKQTVIRAGFGMNYSVGEYAGFATTMAHQPPFTDEQTNEESVGNTPSTACVQTGACFTLANGFPAPATVGNYALDPHYPLPYVETWNLDVQKTLPWGIVMSVGYNGSKANHLDMMSAPRATPSSPGTDPTGLVFNYDQALGFYKMSAGTLRLNKRLSGGVAMGANYHYAHAIDDASAVNGSSATVAQNWQDLAAEEGNSRLVPRHSVSGTYLYELPFGQDKHWLTTGAGAHVLEGLSLSGNFTFASGGWLTPTYTPTATSIACGTAGALRANRAPGISAAAGAGSLRQWFNPAAYSLPSPTTGYCNAFGDAPRNSIEGPGTVENNLALSKTMQLGETRSMEIRATMNNAFNTVQYDGVNTTVGTPTFAQVSSVGAMRSFQFMARFRF